MDTALQVCMQLRAKVEGAVRYCTAKRLYKKCLYTGEKKFLVLVSDTVEQLGVQQLDDNVAGEHMCVWSTTSFQTQAGARKTSRT